MVVEVVTPGGLPSLGEFRLEPPGRVDEPTSAGAKCGPKHGQDEPKQTEHECSKRDADACSEIPNLDQDFGLEPPGRVDESNSGGTKCGPKREQHDSSGGPKQDADDFHYGPKLDPDDVSSVPDHVQGGAKRVLHGPANGARSQTKHPLHPHDSRSQQGEDTLKHQAKRSDQERGPRSQPGKHLAAQDSDQYRYAWLAGEALSAAIGDKLLLSRYVFLVAIFIDRYHEHIAGQQELIANSSRKRFPS